MVEKSDLVEAKKNNARQRIYDLYIFVIKALIVIISSGFIFSVNIFDELNYRLGIWSVWVSLLISSGCIIGAIERAITLHYKFFDNLNNSKDEINQETTTPIEKRMSQLVILAIVFCGIAGLAILLNIYFNTI